MRSILLAVAIALIATPAAAQHCWPSIIVLVVRDANGSVIDPAELDSIGYTPKPSRTAGDFRVRTVRVDTTSDQSYARGPTPVLAFSGQGACRVTMREVVLRGGGETMRLWMDLRVDTQEKPGPTYFALNTPPFAAGTWRLDVCGVPAGQSGRYAPIPPRWTRVSALGDPETPPQMPQNCASAATP